MTDTQDTPVPRPTDPWVERAYRTLLEDLSYTYDGVFSPETIAGAIAEARAALEPNATIATYLPVLVGRYAKEQLLAAAQAEGRIAKAVPEILFICVQNAGRSQLAAALAAHLSGGRVHVRSAGSLPSGVVNPMAIQVLAERGITLTEAYPKPLSDRVVRAADVIITMGCGDACPYYPGKRYEDWAVGDPALASLDGVRAIAADLDTRVRTLLADILPEGAS